MSKIAVTPNASGSGTFTLTTPGTDSDQTITLPNLSGVLQVGGSSIQSIVDSGNSTSITIDSSENVSTSGNLTVGGNLTKNGGGLISSSGTGDTLVISGSNAVNTGGNITLEGNTATDVSQIKFKNGSTEVMRIAGGNLSIGSTDANPFSWSGSSNNVSITADGTNDWAQLSLKGNGTGATGINLGADSVRHAGIFSSPQSHLDFATNSTNSGTSLTTHMRVTSAGDLGLGTTSPRSDTNITTLEVSGSTFARQILQATNTGGREYGLVTGTSGSFLIHDYTASDTRLTLTSAGDVGIGTTTPHLAAWGTEGDPQQLHIDAGSSGTYGVVHISGKGTSSTSHTYSQGVGNQRFYMAYDHTNSVHRMTIEPSGAVTMPTQPAFLAYGSTTYAARSNPMDYNSTNYNIGNHYSTSTYLFTAPVAGRYLFTAGALKTVNGGDGGIIIVQNSTNKARSYHDSGIARQRTISVVLSLSANDTVKVIPEGDTTFYLGSGYGYFSGVLLG